MEKIIWIYKVVEIIDLAQKYILWTSMRSTERLKRSFCFRDFLHCDAMKLERKEKWFSFEQNTTPQRGTVKSLVIPDKKRQRFKPRRLHPCIDCLYNQSRQYVEHVI